MMPKMMPKRLTSYRDRKWARRTRNIQWRFMERIFECRVLWFSPWNKSRRDELADEWRDCLIGGMEICDWMRKHSKWFLRGKWDNEREARPIRLTREGKRACFERPREADMEELHGGLVEPGYLVRPLPPPKEARSMTFHFDEATHAYTLDGVRIPSVTQVLERVGIIDYSFLPDGQRELYLERGRSVHAMTHYDDEGDLDMETVHPDDHGYLAAWRACKADYGWRMAAIEHRRYDPTLRYAGTLDRLTQCGVLLDLKTGSTPWWVGLQLAAYAGLLKRPNLQHAAVELHEDGTYKIDFIPPAKHRENQNTFLAALRVYHATERKGR